MDPKCFYGPCLHPIVDHEKFPYGERRRCLVPGCECRYPWSNDRPPVCWVSPEFRRHMEEKK